MLAWTSAVTFVISLLALGPLRESVPSWLQSGAEVMAVVSLFVLVCFLESGGSNTDKTNPAS